MGRYRAFTLIELLVVIAIIAVLAGMTMGAVATVRESAKATACRSKMGQIGLAMTAYAQDWEGLIGPSFIRAAFVPASWGHPSGESWAWSDPARIGGFLNDDWTMGGTFKRGFGGMFRCPSDRWTGGGISYGLNSNLFAYGATSAAQAAAAWATQLNVVTVRAPSQVIYGVDSHDPRWWGGSLTVTVPPTVYLSSEDLPIDTAYSDPGRQSPYCAFGRHRGGATMVFADGHAGWTRTLTQEVLSRNLYVRLVDIP